MGSRIFPQATGPIDEGLGFVVRGEGSRDEVISVSEESDWSGRETDLLRATNSATLLSSDIVG